MPQIRRLLRAVLVTLAGAGFGWVAPAPAQAAFAANDTSWEGTSELLDLARARLGRDRVELVALLDYSALDPADGVLLLHPEVNIDHEQLSSFLRAGGRVAVLDDYGTGGKLLNRFRIQRVAAPARPSRTLRNNSDLAIAVPFVERVAGHEQGRHPVVAEVEQLVTNHPTALLHPSLTPVLEIPATNEPDATLAVTGIIHKKGRLFAMGDPSAVINLMLRYPGNRAFAEGLVDYLVEDDTWGARGGKLYLLSGKFDQSGHFGGHSSLANEVRQRVDALGEAIAEAREQGIPDVVVVMLAWLAAAAAAGWTAVVALRAQRRVVPRYASPTPLVAQGGVAGRAAVLAAPTTDHGLVLLELKSALEEALVHHLGLQPGASHQRLLEEVDRQGALSRPSSETLKTVLAELSKVAMAVATSQTRSIPWSRVEQTRQRISSILAELEQAKENHS